MIKTLWKSLRMFRLFINKIIATSPPLSKLILKEEKTKPKIWEDKTLINFDICGGFCFIYHSPFLLIIKSCFLSLCMMMPWNKYKNQWCFDLLCQLCFIEYGQQNTICKLDNPSRRWITFLNNKKEYKQRILAGSKWKKIKIYCIFWEFSFSCSFSLPLYLHMLLLHFH